MIKAIFITLTAVLILIVILGSYDSMAYEQAYPKTPVDTVEVKTIPASFVMESRGRAPDYFKSPRGSDTFMPLFNYIQAENIAMTTPVEVDTENNTMWFYAPSKMKKDDLNSTDKVFVKPVTERTVLSVGIRGSYTRENFENGKRKLEDWLSQNSQWKVKGPAYAVYWNGPQTPFFFRTSEVHIPIEAS